MEGATSIDYDDVWTRAKNCIIRNWGGDEVEGNFSSSTQFTLAEAERAVLNAIPEIASIEMLQPNILYFEFDKSRFSSDLITDDGSKRTIYQPIEKPCGIVFAKMVREESQSNE